MILSSSRVEELFQAAKRLVRTECYDSAILALDQAIEHRPTAQFYDYRGVVLTLTLQNEAALESFAKALEMASASSKRAEIFFHRGLLHGREGQHDQALLDFKRACRIKPRDKTYRKACRQLQQEMSNGD